VLIDAKPIETVLGFTLLKGRISLMRLTVLNNFMVRGEMNKKYFLAIALSVITLLIPVVTSKGTDFFISYGKRFFRIKS